MTVNLLRSQNLFVGYVNLRCNGSCFRLFLSAYLRTETVFKIDRNRLEHLISLNVICVFIIVLKMHKYSNINLTCKIVRPPKMVGSLVLGTAALYRNGCQ
jgi:hypothetical protein